MDILVALSQGTGLAVACGIIALLPLGVLAAAAVVGWAPGALAFADDTVFIAVVWAVGVVEAATRAMLPVQVRMGLSALGGGAAFEIAAGGVIPMIGLVAGAPIGAVTAWVTARMVDRAIAGGGPRWGVTALVAVGGIVVAALAIIPIVGFLLLLLVVWGVFRSRKEDRERYAGLRVLR